MRLITLMFIALMAVSPVVAETTVRGDVDKAREAWPLIEQGALVIDVRSQEEFDAGHLEGAVHVPFEETDRLLEAIGADKDRQVVLYCGSGRRAQTAADALTEAGASHVFNASGLDALLATQNE